MIINHPVLNRFSPSIREVEPQLNDDKLIIPNIFSLTGIPPEPVFRATPLSSKNYESSFALQSNASVVNAGQLITNIGNLVSGWWRIKIIGCYKSNYVAAGVNPGDWRFLYLDGVSNWQAIAIFAQLSGSQIINVEHELFLPQVTSMSHIMDANGVGQEQICSISVQGNKYL